MPDASARPARRAVPADEYVHALVLDERGAAWRERDEALRQLDIARQELRAARDRAITLRILFGRRRDR